MVTRGQTRSPLKGHAPARNGAAEPVAPDAVAAPVVPFTEDGFPAEDARRHYEREFKRLKERVLSELVLVTPEMARDWLARNKGNRPLGEPTVKRYARMMLRREWAVNGEPVILDERDNLLDAQHRLHAVVRVGFPVPMLLVYGVDAGAFATLNTGKTRSLADVFAIEGKGSARLLACAVRLFYAHMRGLAPSYSLPVTHKASNAQLVALLDEHKAIHDSVAFVQKRLAEGPKRNNPYPPGPLAFLHYVCHTRHPKEADTFFDRVLTSADLKKDSPEQALSQWILANVGLCSRGGKGLTKYLAVWLKAWAPFVEGRKLTEKLGWRGNGRAKERFPDVA